jgi:hypothetical protein
MTVTYPDQATAPVTAFSTVTQVDYNNTATEVDFNLATSVENRGEVVAIVDGIVQSTSSYDISNSGVTVSFLVAPQATELVLKTVSIPTRFRLLRNFPAVRTVEYSNSTAQVIDGNNYSINAYNQSFALT